MSKEEIVKHMVDFIQESERDLQAAKMSGDNKNGKTDVVNAILNKLEEEIANENKDH
ncbi:hypothetical protein SAMN02910276_00647 [Butyrivibrio sp. Su6]|uniref:hypothetical protein n=1 Tax=Butyrivibrio sp. Su6 TaxID=1520810 RepID=UPI00089F2FFD|nr:hypothetical protein [Butyrivibrio sp. Su6]SEF62156.1 hypothetical protein SAMN02910276_00647 [Butyrivibrio sp. Su6]